MHHRLQVATDSAYNSGHCHKYENWCQCSTHINEYREIRSIQHHGTKWFTMWSQQYTLTYDETTVMSNCTNHRLVTHNQENNCQPTYANHILRKLSLQSTPHVATTNVAECDSWILTNVTDWCLMYLHRVIISSNQTRHWICKWLQWPSSRHQTTSNLMTTSL